MKKSIYPCLWFENQAKQAAEFYCNIFTHSKILNESPIVVNFELNFKITAKNGESFFAAVTTQETLDSGDQLEYQTVNGTISGNIVSDENVYKNYFLLLKSDEPVEVEVTTEIKEIAPKLPPIITVNLGTLELATAVTILAPSLAMPPDSYFRPTMKPVIFCRKTRGIPR